MNIAMVLDMAADAMGDRIAIGRRESGMTYAELRIRARVGAALVRDAGVAAVALAEAAGPIVPVVLFASAWSGTSYAPLNYRLPADARAALLERLEPCLQIEPDAVHDWLTGSEGDMAGPFPDDPERPAVLLYTSGTSSAPKAAVLEHDHLLSYLFNTVEFASAGADEALLLAVPPFHVAGVAAVLSATYSGRRIVPLPTFDAHTWLTLARDEAVTHAFVVPTMLARIVATLGAEPELRPRALRTLSYGGARMPLPVVERALELFPDTGFVNAYGLTETSSTVAVLGPADHRGPAAKLSSVGLPVPGIELRIGEDAEILLRGAQVSGGYLGTDSRVDAEGWLHTGDLGRIDDDGYLYVEGRADDLIISGGENISPAEIEDALLRHPDVDGAAVVGLPDEEWGERVAAMVTVRAGAPVDVDDLRAWCREHVGGLKCPDTLVIRSELPVTATGKILRRVVKTELLGG
jgi:acyl-CoA synthetase (AMP-forming)/AMP-acid ligase II